MPCQVSSQFVETKSQKLMHVLGLEALAGGGAVVGTPSAAHASTWQKPAAARTVGAKMTSFAMRAPLPNKGGLGRGKGRSTSQTRPQSPPETATGLKFRAQVAAAPQ